MLNLIAWRIFIILKTRSNGFKHMLLGITLISFIVGLGFLILSLSHEIVLAEANPSSETNNDIAPSSQQAVTGIVSNTKPVAKSRKQHQPTQFIPQISHEPLTIPASPITASIPILMYHKTPADFDIQLDLLQAKGYTTISTRSLSRILRGQEQSPPKPVVITFDDGYSDQLNAAASLENHNMKATFYIIVGGPLSGWCLGIERHRTDCGDSYLNWEQISTLARSDLFEIGSHTFDHLDLPNLDEAEQRRQITESKLVLERHLGKEVFSFAFPYGRFNSHTQELAREAGYTTAVTTEPGITQSSGQLFGLARIRSTYSLP